MGNPQNPDAPPAPPSGGDGKDWQSLGANIETPGLAVPVDPNYGPPAPTHWDRIAAVNAPEPPPQSAAAPAPEVGVPEALAPPPAQGGKLAESIKLTAPGEVVGGPTQPAFMAPGQLGSVKELRKQAQTEKDETAKAQQGIEHAAAVEKTAIDAQADVDRAKADANAIAYSEKAARDAKIQANEDAGNAAYATRRGQLDDAYAKAIADQDKFVFDPDQYVHNMSLGSKIFTVIAIGLSGMGNSRSIGGSGENLAFKGLNDSIQANVDSQKEQYKRLGARVDRANNAYARARELHLDDAQATAAARQASAAQLATAVDTITARYAGEDVDARRQMMKAHLESEGAKANADFTQRAHADAQQARSNELQLRQANWNAQMGAANYNLAAQGEADRHNQGLAELTMKQQIADQKAAGKGPGSLAGWVGATDNKEMQMAAAKLSARERIMDRNIGELINYRQDYGNEVANQEAKAKAKSTATQLQVLFKDKFQLGAMSDSDKTFLEQVATDPTKIAWTPAVIGQLKHLRDQVRIDTEDEMESYGFQRNREYKPRVLIDAQPKEGGK